MDGNYKLTLWTRLTPELELSNNLVENSMRPLALFRLIGIIVTNND